MKQQWEQAISSKAGQRARVATAVLLIATGLFFITGAARSPVGATGPTAGDPSTQVSTAPAGGAPTTTTPTTTAPRTTPTTSAPTTTTPKTTAPKTTTPTASAPKTTAPKTTTLKTTTPTTTTPKTPPPASQPSTEAQTQPPASSGNWMTDLLPQVDPGGAAGWEFWRNGGWGATDGHTVYIDPDVPADKRFSVMIHEYSHVLQVQVYGSLEASAAAMSARSGMSPTAANESVADCMALMQGATWVHYGCQDSLRGAAEAILAGNRV